MAHKVPFLDDKLLDTLQRIDTPEEIASFVNKQNLFLALDSSNNTLLHWAARWENTVIAKYMIKSRSQIEAKNNLGQNPLMLAIIYNSEDVIEILLRAKAKINVEDNCGKSVLRMISESEWVSTKILRLIVWEIYREIHCHEREKNIAKKLYDAGWPLHYIIQLVDVEITKHGLQNGYAAKVDSTDQSGQTALHIAVKTIDVKNVKVLLEFNANVNILDCFYRTPLSYVYDENDDCHDKKLQILKMLLDRRAVLGNVTRACNAFKFASKEAITLLLNANIVLAADAMGRLSIC